MKTVIFAKDVNLSKLVEMLKICPCCKYVSNLYQTITFTSLLRMNTYLANICICPHFSRQRKFNANLELQIYHIFAPFANISKSVFSSSVGHSFPLSHCFLVRIWYTINQKKQRHKPELARASPDEIKHVAGKSRT